MVYTDEEKQAIIIFTGKVARFSFASWLYDY